MVAPLEGEFRREKFSPQWRRAFEWVERTVGGTVVRAQRQPRWRPAYFLDVERDGELLPLYFRGDRGFSEGINAVYDVEYESRFYPILEAHGVPVPHLYGLCRDPLGVLLDRMPGRCNLATAESPAERESVLDHYMEILARIHAIDASELTAVGLPRPASPEAISLGDFDLWVGEYHKGKRRPDPLLEFLIAWCRRNAPADRDEVRLVLSDAGQFLFDSGRVTAVLDLELSYLGDPLADLAGLRSRDLAEPLGDLARGLRHYEAVSGRPVDLDVVRYHAVRFNLYTPLTTANLLAAPTPELDYGQYLAWHVAWARASLDAMAELMRVDVPPIEVPHPHRTPYSAPCDWLVGLLGDPDPDAAAGEDDYQRYWRQSALRTAQLLQCADRLAPALDAEERDELGALLGRSPASFEEADVALEEIVLAAGPERDEELLRYFHRRIQRDHERYRAAMWEVEDSVMQPIG